ncbi:MAG TPA: hypothetical protein VD907_06510 [Verrucomicrobiae bacterium]|nr:hypothetical protein [Verrucomicrobiae bacterium]
MFERRNNIYVKAIGLSLLGGALLWLLLVILTAASADKNPSLPHVDHVTLGPLLLATITRAVAAGGTTVTFGVEIGSLFFFLAALVIGVVISIILSRHSQ